MQISKIHAPLAFQRAYNYFAMKIVTIFLLAILLILIAVVAIGQTSSVAPLNDPVAKLAKRIDRGEVKLDYAENGWGYLPSLLKELDINVDSQILVFSKTSFQL